MFCDTKVKKWGQLGVQEIVLKNERSQKRKEKSQWLSLGFCRINLKGNLYKQDPYKPSLTKHHLRYEGFDLLETQHNNEPTWM